VPSNEAKVIQEIINLLSYLILLGIIFIFKTFYTPFISQNYSFSLLVSMFFNFIEYFSLYFISPYLISAFISSTQCKYHCHAIVVNSIQLITLLSYFLSRLDCEYFLLHVLNFSCRDQLSLNKIIYLF